VNIPHQITLIKQLKLVKKQSVTVSFHTYNDGN